MSERPASGPRLLAIAAVTLVMAMPIAWMLATSFKPPGEIVQAPLALLPRAPTLQHYRQLLADNVWRLALNSLLVTAGTTLLALAVALPAAYGLARFRFPRRLDVVFLTYVLLVKLTPPIVLAVPLYQVLRTLGVLDTLPGLVLANQILALPFAIWMLLGFVRDVPLAIEEAAMIDGARLGRRLVDIVAPMLAPGLVATGVLVAVTSWNEFLFALLFMQSPSNFTLPVYVATLVNEDATLWGRLTAVGILASLPILFALGVVHRALTRGIGGGLH